MTKIELEEVLKESKQKKESLMKEHPSDDSYAKVKYTYNPETGMPVSFTIQNHNNTIANQGNSVSHTVITFPDAMIDRLEDMGRLHEKIDEILDSHLFQLAEDHKTKKTILPADIVEEIMELKQKIVDCWMITSSSDPVA